MILRAGLAATHLVTFSTGLPDGDVAWSLLADDGTLIDSGTITPAAEQVSVLIPLSAAATALPNGEYTLPLDVTWSYTVGGAIQNGEARYTVEARLPLGISADGVRRKLGVSPSELPDHDISLVTAYLTFENTIDSELFELVVGTSNLTDVRIRDGIEALAALSLIPTMAIRIASSESSGTNQFKRQEIDWGAIASDLGAIVAAGYVAVDSNYDPFAVTGALFLLATPTTDPFTGATG